MHEIQITVTSNTTADVRLGKTPRRQARRQLHGREHPSPAQPPDRLNRQTGAIEDGTTSARTKNLEGLAELARWPGRRTHARLLAGSRWDDAKGAALSALQLPEDPDALLAAHAADLDVFCCASAVLSPPKARSRRRGGDRPRRG